MSALSMKLASRPGWWATVIARLVVGGVFVAAAVPKLLDPAGFADDISNYHLIPDGSAAYVAVMIPVLEVVVGLALITGFEAKGAAVVACAMLIAFTAAMGQAMARGIDLSCGCFGKAVHAEVGWTSIGRNAALLLACAFVIVAPEARWRRVSPNRAAAETARSGTEESSA